jgi:hypothetical protein
MFSRNDFISSQLSLDTGKVAVFASKKVSEVETIRLQLDIGAFDSQNCRVGDRWGSRAHSGWRHGGRHI